MSSTNRRNFLKKSGSTLGASLATAEWLKSRRIHADDSSGFKRIKYRMLGSTGFKVSEVGFGAMNTRDPELIHAAIDAGINYIDTAHGYMKGVNEEIVGKVLKTKRDKVFLTTKVFWRNQTGEQLREKMELSLKRLQVDHVDFMLMHMTHDRETALKDEYIKTFDKARKDGLCRFVGISTHKNHVESINAAVDSKFWEAVLVAYNYKSPQEVTDAIIRARNAGLAIIAMKTQDKGNGYKTQDMGDMTINQAALKWVLENRYVDTTIPGMMTFDHLAEDLDVMGMRLSFHEGRKLKRYGELNNGSACRGVAGCTGCTGQCPYGVDICDLNRCLGYAYGYGDRELATENYNRLPESSRVDVCSDCDECSVKCVFGLDVNDTVRRARELFA